MTNQLQKQFFDTFGVEPKYKCTKDGNCYFQECSKCGWYIRTYPQITDRILLHLLSILNNYGNIISSNNIKKLEDEILIKIITLSKDIDIKPQVRALFSNK